MRTLWQDVRFGLRVLRNSPSFTAVAVLTLALGIAANTTVYSWLDAILLDPLPGVPNSRSLLVLEPVVAGEQVNNSFVEYRFYRDHLKLVSGIAATHMDGFQMGRPGAERRVWGELVSANYFDLFGIAPVKGRVFHSGDFGDALGSYPVAVISERLWRSEYNADPQILGKTIRLNGNELTIVGVTPASFLGSVSGLRFDVWAPLPMTVQMHLMNAYAFEYRGSRGINAFARLKPGVTLDQARAELASAARQLDAISPATARNIGANFYFPQDSHSGAAALLREPLGILMAAAALLFLIVCANLANLLLARSVSRQKEYGIRMSLGAGSARLTRQLLTETVVLAAAGALLAIPAIAWLQEALLWMMPGTDMPVVSNHSFNPRVLGFTLLICLAAVAVSGIAPALTASRHGLNELLKQGGRSGSGVLSNRTRGVLVVSEVALAVVALVGAGLAIRTFQNARNAAPGLNPHNVLVSRFYLSGAGYDVADVFRFTRTLRQRLQATPGVVGVTYADSVPLGLGSHPWHELQIPGYTPAPNENMKIERAIVDPGYFDLLRIPILDGRDFRHSDNEKAPRVMVVNESFARRFFGEHSVLGRKVMVERREFTVVGVSKDSKYHSASEPARPYFYAPFHQWFNIGLGVNFLVKTAGDQASAAAAMRAEVARLDPNAATFDSSSLLELAAISLYPQKVSAALLAVLAGLCLLLASIGLYSVMSYAVNQRLHEMGIRMAVGATPGNVIGMVVREGMMLTGLGLIAGLAAALAVTRLIASMLIGVTAADPLTFAAAAAFLLTIALLATYIPARRATRVDPLTALRSE